MGSGAVDEQTGANRKLLATQLVLYLSGQEFALLVFFKTKQGQVVGQGSPFFCCCFSQEHTIAGIVELAIVVQYCTVQFWAQAFGALQNLLFADPATFGHAVAFGKGIVNAQANGVITAFHPGITGGKQGQWMSQKRSILDHNVALFQSVAHLFELSQIKIIDGLLQVANPAMDEFGRFGRGGGSKVVFFNQGDFEATQGCIQRTSSARSARANDADVEGFRLEFVQMLNAIHLVRQFGRS